jgi:hypothetical protein
MTLNEASLILASAKMAEVHEHVEKVLEHKSKTQGFEALALTEHIEWDGARRHKMQLLKTGQAVIERDLGIPDWKTVHNKIKDGTWKGMPSFDEEEA